MLFLFLGVIAGLALIIPAGLAHAHFVREHPYIEDFYTKEDKSRARSSFSIQLVGGIACIFAGVCSVILFGEDSENIFGVSIMLSLIALGVCFIIHGGMTLGRTNIVQYNQKASEFLENPRSQPHQLSLKKISPNSYALKKASAKNRTRRTSSPPCFQHSKSARRHTIYGRSASCFFHKQRFSRPPPKHQTENAHRLRV